MSQTLASYGCECDICGFEREKNTDSLGASSYKTIYHHTERLNKIKYY